MTRDLAIIGAGYWGKNLIREFNKLGILHTICDNNQETIEKYRNDLSSVYVTDNWNEILENPEITKVCISLPAEMHYKYAKAALLADKDVFVEKPITLDLGEAKELLDLADENEKILMVGHLLQYHSCIIKIKEIINSGQLGKVKNIISNRLNLGKFRKSENVLWSFAPHDISVILSLCQNKLPDQVFCIGKSVLTKDIPDITNTVMKYNHDDIYVNINVNWLNPYKEQKLVIICEKGMLMFDDVRPTKKLELYRNYLKWENTTTPYLPLVNNKTPEFVEYQEDITPLENECRHFIESCANRSQPLSNGLEGYRVLQVLHMAQDSLNNGYIRDTKMYSESTSATISAKSKGLLYRDGYWYHETAIIDPGCTIGEGTYIWHNTHICKGAEIGKNCSLGQGVFMASDAVLGDGCRVQNNVSIYSGVICHENVFLGPSCVLTNDKNPRVEYSKNGNYFKTIIKKGASICAGAVIVCGNTVNEYAVVGAGAVLTKDAEAYTIYVGNPAKVLKKTNEKFEL